MYELADFNCDITVNIQLWCQHNLRSKICIAYAKMFLTWPDFIGVQVKIDNKLTSKRPHKLILNVHVWPSIIQNENKLIHTSLQAMDFSINFSYMYVYHQIRLFCFKIRLEKLLWSFGHSLLRKVDLITHAESHALQERKSFNKNITLSKYIHIRFSELDMCLRNTDVPAAAKSKSGKISNSKILTPPHPWGMWCQGSVSNP